MTTTNQRLAVVAVVYLLAGDQVSIETTLSRCRLLLLRLLLLLGLIGE